MYWWRPVSENNSLMTNQQEMCKVYDVINDTVWCIPSTYIPEKAKIFRNTPAAFEGGSNRHSCERRFPEQPFHEVPAVSQTKLLKKAASMLVDEREERKQEKERVVKECFPPLKLSGLSVEELQVPHKSTWFLYFETISDAFLSLQELCRELHQKIDVTDEARYDIELKVSKNEKEVNFNESHARCSCNPSMTHFDSW